MSASVKPNGGDISEADGLENGKVRCPAGCGAKMDENQLPHHIRENCPTVIAYRKREAIGEYRRDRDHGRPDKETNTQLHLSQFGAEQ